AADDQRVDLLHEVHEEVDLGGDLRAADDGDDRAVRIAEALFKGFEFRLHGAAGIGGQQVGEAFRRGVRAVRGREGIVDVDVAVGGEGCGEIGVVLLFALVETGVFEKQDTAVVECGDGGRGRLADAV